MDFAQLLALAFHETPQTSQFILGRISCGSCDFDAMYFSENVGVGLGGLNQCLARSNGRTFTMSDSLLGTTAGFGDPIVEDGLSWDLG